MLLDNRLVDYWFDEEVRPLLKDLNYSLHELTPELLKYKLLQNQIYCFKYEDFVILGELNLTLQKEFFIMYLAGQNIRRHYAEFLDEMKRFGVCQITGHNIDKINILHRRNLSQFTHDFTSKSHYFIDLGNYNESFPENEHDECWVLMPNTHIDYWWDSLTFKNVEKSPEIDKSILKTKLLANQLFCYKINGCAIIGFVNSGIYCKQFVIVWLEGKNCLSKIGNFFNHLELVECCRYVSFLGAKCYDRLFDRCISYLKAKNIVRKQNFSFLSLKEDKNGKNIR